MEKISEMELKREQFREEKRRNDPRMVNVLQAFEVQPQLGTKFQEVIKQTFSLQGREKSSETSIVKKEVKSKRDSAILQNESSSFLHQEKKQRGRPRRPKVKFSQQMVEHVFSDYDPTKNNEVVLDK